MESESKGPKCSMIAVMGMTNAGKSTLINRIVGFKASIVTYKVHTTRFRMNAVLNTDNVQLVFTDTPGVFAPKTKLEKFIVKNAWMSMKGVDAAILVLNSGHHLSPNTLNIVKRIKSSGIPAVAVLNKADLLDEKQIEDALADIRGIHDFEKVFAISSLSGHGIGSLVNFLKEIAPCGPWLYPDNQRTDATLEFFTAEITREKLFFALRQELPYSLSVVTEQIEERKKSIIIKQVVYVTKSSQKTIVVGKDASVIKEVCTASREELKNILNKEVHLYLFVKVRKFWQDSLHECIVGL